jgi:hypothetical protein
MILANLRNIVLTLFWVPATFASSPGGIHKKYNNLQEVDEKLSFGTGKVKKRSGNCRTYSIFVVLCLNTLFMPVSTESVFKKNLCWCPCEIIEEGQVPGRKYPKEGKQDEKYNKANIGNHQTDNKYNSDNDDQH